MYIEHRDLDHRSLNAIDFHRCSFDVAGEQAMHPIADAKAQATIPPALRKTYSFASPATKTYLPSW
jgi:hypothetical protein